MIDRRSFLVTGTGAALALGFAPRLAFAKAATAKRFVFIIQRGAADGLGMVAPIGDPAFAGVRGALADEFAGARAVDGMFAIHPGLKTIGGLFDQRHALFAHAVASPYRDRSHFDGQNVLETGGPGAYQVKDGWLNRLLGALPVGEAKAIAVSVTVPLALRGSHQVASYAPSALPEANEDLIQRVGLRVDPGAEHAGNHQRQAARQGGDGRPGPGGQAEAEICGQRGVFHAQFLPQHPQVARIAHRDMRGAAQHIGIGRAAERGVDALHADAEHRGRAAEVPAHAAAGRRNRRRSGPGSHRHRRYRTAGRRHRA